MKKLMYISLLLGLLMILAYPVNAEEYTAPEAPDSVQDLMPVKRETFWEGVSKIIENALRDIQPSFVNACSVCVRLLAMVLLVSVTETFVKEGHQVFAIVSSLAISVLLIGNAQSMISLAGKTVKELSEYGKLLLPVMAGVLAAQGGPVTSAALYAGTVTFDAVISWGISTLLTPLVYAYLVLSVVMSATGEETVKRLRDLAKSVCSWSLKTLLYIFTGYMAITGVVSGTTDATTLKATKLTISGMIPVVGGILSEASEAVLVGAGIMKNAAGIYGMLVLIALLITPFMQIGIQYLLLKATAALCAAFGSKQITELIASFSTAMGLLLAMIGAVCIMLLISTVCFMRGTL